jgi:hypothetical protein
MKPQPRYLVQSQQLEQERGDEDKGRRQGGADVGGASARRLVTTAACWPANSLPTKRPSFALCGAPHKATWDPSDGEDFSPFTSFDGDRLDDRRKTYRRGPDQLESRSSEQLHELLLGSLSPA